MRTFVTMSAMMSLAVIAMPAVAKDRVGYQAIAAGSLSQAERTLAAERAIYPERPELMLNLAAVYAKTGRLAQARALYGDVLQQQPVSMDLADGSVETSHQLAQRGLLRLSSTMAAR